MKVDANEIRFRVCDESDLDAIVRLEQLAFESLPDPSWLRKNGRDAFAACLQPPHVTLGAIYQGHLIAFAILYHGGFSAENLGQDLDAPKGLLPTIVNLKVVIVSPDYHGNTLQKRLSIRLEEMAVKEGMSLICTTVSPHNIYSLRNLEQMGYVHGKKLIKYDNRERLLLYKAIDRQGRKFSEAIMPYAY